MQVYPSSNPLGNAHDPLQVPLRRLSLDVENAIAKNGQNRSLSVLQNLLSADASIQALSEDERINAGEISDLLLTAFSAITSDTKKIEFTFDGYHYVLFTDESRHEDLILKDNFGREIRLKNTSLEKCQSRAILLNLFNQLNSTAQTTFLPLFDIEEIAQVEADSPIVSGDADGSTARSIVLGIQAGITVPDAQGITLFVNVLNAEAKMLSYANALLSGNYDNRTANKIWAVVQDSVATLTKLGVELPAVVRTVMRESGNDGVKKLEKILPWAKFLIIASFQTDQQVQNDMEKLVGHLTFTKGHTPLIFIGDGAHDRFSTNKDVDRKIREEMKKQGAIYIAGNHDVYFKKEFDDIEVDDRLDFLVSYGCLAKDTATAEEWVAHQGEVLSNTYYDENANTFYSHHGFDEDDSEDEGKIVVATAFGIASLSLENVGIKSTLVNFSNFLNDQPRPRPDSLFEEDAQARDENDTHFYDFCGFRADEINMQKIAQRVKIRLVHGHNGFKDTLSSADVIALNSRQQQTVLAVVAARIGTPYSAPKFDGVANKRALKEISVNGVGEQEVKNKKLRMEGALILGVA